jgi:hypothetical protein
MDAESNIGVQGLTGSTKDAWIDRMPDYEQMETWQLIFELQEARHNLFRKMDKEDKGMLYCLLLAVIKRLGESISDGTKRNTTLT